MENVITPCAVADRPALLIPIETLIAELRAAGRLELIHYAGAARRDLVAWHVCREYLADREASESTLKSRAYLAAYGWAVSPGEIDAVRAAISAKPDFVTSAGGAL